MPGWFGATDYSSQKSNAQHRATLLLFITNNLKEYRARDVVTSALVDDNQFALVNDQISNVRERDVATFLGVIQSSIRVFLDNSSSGHLGPRRGYLIDILQSVDIPVLCGPLPDFRDCGGFQVARWMLLQRDQGTMQFPFGMLQRNPFAAMTFAELLALVVNGDRNMAVVRLRITKEVLQPDLPGRGVHQINATHDVGYALQVVIDNNGNLVGNQLVPPQDDEIA